MQGNTPGLSWLLSLVGGVLGQPALAANAPSGQTLYPAESRQSFKGPETYFTGDVQVDMLFPDKETAHFSGAYVTFQPGARTAWHQHPGEQHTIVTSGVALTGTRDGTVIAFEEGETVWCPSDIDHWHGATPHAAMTHLVITGSKHGENVTWKEKITDEEYQRWYRQTRQADVAVQALSAQQQAIVPIAAATAKGDLEALKRAVASGLEAGLTVNAIKEVEIHLYAYAGFPRALNGLATLMGVVESRKAEGIEDPVGPEVSGLPEDKSPIDVGKAVQTQLSGKPVTGPLFDFAPAINAFLQSHLFGDLFARDALDDKSREIATVSALASLDGVQSQLQAHIGIAANAGLTEQQIRELALVLTQTVGKKEGRRAEQAIEAAER